MRRASRAPRFFRRYDPDNAGTRRACRSTRPTRRCLRPSLGGRPQPLRRGDSARRPPRWPAVPAAFHREDPGAGGWQHVSAAGLRPGWTWREDRAVAPRSLAGRSAARSAAARPIRSDYGFRCRQACNWQRRKRHDCTGQGRHDRGPGSASSGAGNDEPNRQACGADTPNVCARFGDACRICSTARNGATGCGQASRCATFSGGGETGGSPARAASHGTGRRSAAGRSRAAGRPITSKSGCETGAASDRRSTAVSSDWRRAAHASRLSANGVQPAWARHRRAARGSTPAGRPTSDAAAGRCGVAPGAGSRARRSPAQPTVGGAPTVSAPADVAGRPAAVAASAGARRMATTSTAAMGATTCMARRSTAAPLVMHEENEIVDGVEPDTEICSGSAVRHDR